MKIRIEKQNKFCKIEIKKKNNLTKKHKKTKQSKDQHADLTFQA
jgi:hypothetical protein